MFYDKELIAHKLTRWEKVISNFSLPSWENIPNFGLYMDQVILLLTQYLEIILYTAGKEASDDEQKVFTAAAINNYVRLKIMPAPIKKKYYRVHIAYLIMIFTLKQSLSINLLKEIIPECLSEEQVKSIYTSYVNKHHEVSLSFVDTVRRNTKDILDPTSSGNTVSDFIVEEALIAGFAKIFTEKMLKLKGLKKEEVIITEIDRG